MGQINGNRPPNRKESEFVGHLKNLVQFSIICFVLVEVLQVASTILAEQLPLGAFHLVRVNSLCIGPFMLIWIVLHNSSIKNAMLPKTSLDRFTEFLAFGVLLSSIVPAVVFSENQKDTDIWVWIVPVFHMSMAVLWATLKAYNMVHDYFSNIGM